MNNIALNPLLTIAEVAESLGVSSGTVRRWIRNGDLEALKLGTGERASVRIAPAALVRFVSTRAPKGAAV